MKISVFYPFLILLLFSNFALTAQTSEKNDSIPGNKTKPLEVMPVFPGGQPALMQFIIHNVKYPEAGLRKGLYGTVYATFLIDSTGRVKDATVLKSPGKEFSDEALRVIAMMPRWKPGMQEGKPVNVIYNLPFVFNIQGSGPKAKHYRFYDADGLNFTYLKNWEVSSSKTEKGTEIKLERKGFGNTGTVFIYYQNDTTNTLTLLNNTTETITSRSAEAMPIKFKPPVATSYQFYKAWKAAGQMQLNENAERLIGKMLVDVYTFNAGGRSYTLKIIQTDEDRPGNQPLLDKLEATFKPHDR